MSSIATFRKQNLWLGWIIFLVTAIVYCWCIEPTASFWDCGEYIACSNGLETGHPPGAPFFLLLARAFSLLSFGNKELVAPLINCLSALASAFTVLFLFWSITHLVKKVLLKTEEDYTKTKTYLVLLAGAVGALSYAFTDSFWFSAEEGEVYALSSLFTAIVFWAMLKWENVADDPHSDRWLVFIAYMIGLSIGVHLLNLLTIPSLVFIWYYRKYPDTNWWKFLLAGVIGVALLGGVQDVLIPGIVSLAGKTELLFVNKFHLGFNSGISTFFATLATLLVAGIAIGHRKKIRWLTTSFLSLTVLLIGYSSFFVLVIRAQAGTPINEGNPSNPISMLSYLNREQYGDWPLLYGQYYNTPLDIDKPYLDGDPVYVKDTLSGRYIVSDARKNYVPNYDKAGCTIFPRMYSSGYASGYANTAHVEGDTVLFRSPKGQKPYPVLIPTFGENLKFFFGYQVGWMYGRYFLWNFMGRQNDHLGYGNDAEGNVLTGVSFVDNRRLGDYSVQPEAQKKNKARNRYFMIPLLLGVIGFLWQAKHAARDNFIVSLLFLCTGLLIVFYLNQTPWQPRERDYAYVGSFYAFAIWIGFGVIGVYRLFRSFLSTKPAMGIALVISALSPVLLFSQNLDDHNRRGRTAARDVAIDMLESCEQNAILFTYADNDTFPLWYAQEVLGIRRDVRIVCLSLLRSDWYIDQLKRKQYTSDPLPVSMTHWQYRDGTRDFMNIFEETDDTISLQRAAQLMVSQNFGDRFVSTTDDTLNYLPTRNVSLVVNRQHVSPIKLNSPSEKTDSIIYWRLRGEYLLKDQVAVVDILAHNDWKRPVYFAMNMPVTCYAGLDDYLRLEGLVYHMVPVKNTRDGGSLQSRPAVLLDKSYELVMHTFQWGGLKDESVYSDETVKRMFSDMVRGSCAKIATALAEEGKPKEAIAVINKCVTEIPASQVAPDQAWLELVDAAYLAGDLQLAQSLSRAAFQHSYDSFRWYGQMRLFPYNLTEVREAMIALYQMADNAGDDVLVQEYEKQLKSLAIPLPQEPPPLPEDTLMLQDSLMDSAD